MSNENVGWDISAEAWIRNVETDVNRLHVLDPVMREQAGDVQGKRVLDVGCGEGRFCRMMGARGAVAVGIDPTAKFIERAQERDPGGEYRVAGGEALPFEDESFDLVVGYLVLIDIADFQAAIREMARVVKPGGRILIANLNSFVTTMVNPWIQDDRGWRLYFAMDNYPQEREAVVTWSGIVIKNHHRPLHMYMNAFINAGLRLERYLEPVPTEDAISLAPSIADYKRIPYMNVMVWSK